MSILRFCFFISTRLVFNISQECPGSYTLMWSNLITIPIFLVVYCNSYSCPTFLTFDIYQRFWSNLSLFREGSRCPSPLVTHKQIAKGFLKLTTTYTDTSSAIELKMKTANIEIGQALLSHSMYSVLSAHILNKRSSTQSLGPLQPSCSSIFVSISALWVSLGLLCHL